MCGRYSLIADIGQLALRFEFDAYGLAQPPRYNIAPTQPVLTVRSGGPRRASYMRWGLIPSGARTAPSGAPIINTRAETVAERPNFRASLLRRRCLIPADGFYEWRRTGAARQPVRVTLASGEPFALAGLWDAWRDPRGEVVESCTIITTDANDLLQPVHDRMPVILPEEFESLWLDEQMQDAAALASMLGPYPSERMETCEISTLVNSAHNDGPELIAPAEQGRLI
ncbi:MAG: SOS response-associated peptidase [Chloroflexota bacterium]|nr:SOS response-associated peptidase [Chloroflexota bacterium]MDE2884347.1 SOS response-associated peptidase [Chloroflexota bacterium]